MHEMMEGFFPLRFISKEENIAKLGKMRKCQSVG